MLCKQRQGTVTAKALNKSVLKPMKIHMRCTWQVICLLTIKDFVSEVVAQSVLYEEKIKNFKLALNVGIDCLPNTKLLQPFMIHIYTAIHWGKHMGDVIPDPHIQA